MLHPSNETCVNRQANRHPRSDIDEEESDLDETDKQNNNYLSRTELNASDSTTGSTAATNSPSTPRVKTKSTSDEYENDDAKRVIRSGKSGDQTPSSKSPATRQRLDSSRNGATKLRSMSDIRKDFQLGDIIDFVHKGIEVSLQDLSHVKYK